MDTFSIFAGCCALAAIALLFIIGRNYRRYRSGIMPRRVYMRDCMSNAGIALVASSLALLRLGSLVPPAMPATIIWITSYVAFFAGVACIITGFGLLVRENRQRV